MSYMQYPIGYYLAGKYPKRYIMNDILKVIDCVQELDTKKVFHNPDDYLLLKETGYKEHFYENILGRFERTYSKTKFKTLLNNLDVPKDLIKLRLDNDNDYTRYDTQRIGAYFAGYFKPYHTTDKLELIEKAKKYCKLDVSDLIKLTGSSTFYSMLINKIGRDNPKSIEKLLKQFDIPKNIMKEFIINN